MKQTRYRFTQGRVRGLVRDQIAVASGRDFYALREETPNSGDNLSKSGNQAGEILLVVERWRTHDRVAT